MIHKDFKWTALFSHTGQEIYKISKQLGRYPDKIITNNPPGSDIFEKIKSRDITYVKKTPAAEDYAALLEPDHVITLHGWMRIVPEVICAEYEIYNLHPGLITKYPELKGKDPQKRVAEEEIIEYKRIGCVIHKVIPEVDAGDILLERSVMKTSSNESVITDTLRDMASSMWVDFFDLYSKGTIDELL